MPPALPKGPPGLKRPRPPPPPPPGGGGPAPVSPRGPTPKERLKRMFTATEGGLFPMFAGIRANPGPGATSRQPNEVAAKSGEVEGQSDGLAYAGRLLKKLSPVKSVLVVMSYGCP